VYQPTPVLVLDIDDTSIEELGQWPWPRHTFAEIVDTLTEYGAASIAFDILFSEPDRTSPTQITNAWPSLEASPEAAEAIMALPDHDEQFANAIRRSNVVLGLALTPEGRNRLPEAKVGFVFAGSDPLPFAPNYRGVVSNLEVLEKAANGNGSFNVAIENDGIIRRVPLVFGFEGKLFPSLIAEALRTAQGAKSIAVKTSNASGSGSFGQATGITTVKIGRMNVPTAKDGSVLVHYTRTAPGRTISIADIFDPGFDRTSIEGKIILIGTSAAGLKDQRATPLNPLEAGVNIHAEALEQIILGKYLHRPDWADGAELMAILFFGSLLVFSLQFFGVRLSAAIVFFFVSCLLSASWLAFVRLDWLVDPIYLSFTSAAIFLSYAFQIYMETESEKRGIRSAFGLYLSPHLVEQLAEDPEKLQLGGEQKELTILFADIIGFTSISENLEPHALTSFMNNYLSPMTEVILESGGTIDKYIGDAIMAFWNAPLDDKEHARNACSAVVNMHVKLQELNNLLEAEAREAGKRFVPIRIGVGLNTGEVCVGNLGSIQRFDYSVMGDVVNTASRLEGQTRPYGFDTIVGENTHSQADDFAMIEIDLIRVKGKNRPVRIFALFGDEATGRSQNFIRLKESANMALEHYRNQDWQSASTALGQLRNSGGSKFQVYVELMLERIETFRSNPPSPEWDGVFTATSK
jgi:adenylate cyclase